MLVLLPCTYLHVGTYLPARPLRNSSLCSIFAVHYCLSSLASSYASLYSVRLCRSVVLKELTNVCGEEITKLRQGMWQDVGKRRHTVAGAFVNVSENGDKLVAEFMLHGLVTYQLRGKEEGEEKSVDWAAHGRLVRVALDQPWGFAYYRVYLQR